MQGQLMQHAMMTYVLTFSDHFAGHLCTELRLVGHSDGILSS